MFTIFMILLSIAIAALGVMAFFGIEQYLENSIDDDVNETYYKLKKILYILLVVVIVSLGIMAFSHYSEKPTNVQYIQVEAK